MPFSKPSHRGCTAKTKALFVLATFLCALPGLASAATITKKYSSANLNGKSSWIGNGVPGAGDIALWNSTVTTALANSLGGNLSWLGIQITNPGGAITINAGYTLTLGTSGINMSAATQNLTLNCALMLGSTQVWDVTTGRTLAAAGVIGGAGGLTKNGLGTVSMTGTNTFTGATTINGGTVAISSGAGLGVSTAVATINAGTLALVAGKTAATTRQFRLGHAASTIQVDSGSTFTLSGTVSNGATAGNLIKTGAGTLILSAATGNTYGGAGQTTSINGGTLQVGNDNQLGNIATSVTFNGGTLMFSSGFTSARSVVLNAASGTINTNNNSATLSGTLSGAGSLTKAGAGTLTLSGTNTYSGGTSVTGGNSSILSLSNAANAGSGLVTLGGGSVLLSTANFTFSNGLVLGAVGGSAQPDGNLVSGIVNVPTGTTLTLSGTGISEATSGTGRLEKLGGGTLVMNTANTYSGGTYLHEGTFIFGNAGALGPQPANDPTFNQLTIDNGAQLRLSTGGAFRRNVLIGTGGGVLGATTAGNVAYRNGVFSNVSAQSGGVTVDSGANGFGGNNTFIGNLTISSGAIAAISRDANLGALANQILLNGGGTLRIEDGVDITGTGGTTASTVLATFSSNRQITLGSGTGTIEVKNFADTNPSFDASGSNPIVPAGGRPASHTNTFTLNGSLTGAGGLIKAGDGILVLANAANNYTGGTTINGGILSVADATALGAGSNPLTINPGGIFQATSSFATARAVTLGGTGGAASGGTFDVTGTNIETRNGVISGAGSLTKTGTGTLLLEATNTFTGDFYINGGTVSITNNQALGPQPPSLGSSLYAVHMANGTSLQTAANSFGGNRQLELVSGTATLDVTSSFTQQRNGLVYGSGGLIKTGSGTQILTNANTYSGGTTINNGTLQANNATGSATGSGAVVVNNGGVLSGLPTATGFANPGSLSGTVTVNSGGAIQARSGGTFTFGGLALNTSAITNFQIGAPAGTAIINITGVDGLSLAGLSTVNISNTGGLAAGTYNLFDYTGTALTSIANLQLGSTAGGGFTYSLSNNQTSTSIDLVVSLSNQQWANDANGNWNVTSNWTNGVVPNAVGAQANFFGLINQARTVTVNGAFTIGNMAFDDADAYTVADSGFGGDGLTLNNGSAAAINVSLGSHTLSAPLTLASDLQLAAAAGTGLTISGAISESGGSRAVTNSGAGSMTFAGGAANSYSGLTTVSAGTLSLNKTAGVNAIGSGGVDIRSGAALTLLAANQIADTAVVIANGSFGLGAFAETIGALSGSGAVTTSAGGTLTVGASNNLHSEFDGVISGAGTISKAGSGTLTLDGANTFGGSGQAVSVNGGTLSVASDGNLGNVANSLTFNGGSLSFAASFNTSRDFFLTGAGSINTNNNSAILSGILSGAGSLTKAGAGTLTLSGTNTYAGGTFITGGNSSALSISSASNLGSGAVTFSGGSALASTTDLTLTNNFTFGATGGGSQGDGLAVSGIFNVASGSTLIQSSGVISGGRLMKDGTGVLDLRGSNTYTGGTYLHNGVIVINSGASLGVQPDTSNPFSNALTIDNGATLRNAFNGAGFPGRGLLIGNGGAQIDDPSGITQFRNGPIANVSGQSGGLTKLGLGTQGLGGTNTFTGAVQVTSGLLSVSRDANLGAVSNQLSFAGGAGLRIEDGLDNHGATPAVPVLATFNTSRQINLLAGNVTFEVKNYADTNPSFGAVAAPASHLNTFTIDGFITGAGALVKNGDGTLVLSNGANNYSGGTIINNGTLSVANAIALGAATSGMAINNNAIFQTTGSFNTARLVTLGGTGGPAGVGGGIFEVSSGVNQTRSGVISGDGSLSKNGSGTLNLLADNTYAGGSFLNSGIVAIDRSTSLGSISSSATIGNATLEVLNDIATTRNHSLSHASSAVQVDEGATYTVGGVISGSGSLNKTGAGTIALTGTNTYAGGTFINGGTIAINNPGNLGAAGNSLTVNAGTVRVITGYTTARNITLGHAASTIEVDPAQTQTLTGVLSGTGALNKTGSGALSLSGANTFTGETVVDEGTLTLAAGAGSALASTSAVTVNNGGTLLLGANNQIRDVAPVTLGGGTFAKGNFSEGTAGSAGLGGLTLTDSGSHIDFGSGTVGILSFASFSAGIDPDFESLIIDNWTGNANTVGNAFTDRLIFNASQSGNLAYFNFTGYADGATQFSLGGGFYEVTPLTPVPEPATYFAGALALLGLGYHQRRRLRRFAQN